MIEYVFLISAAILFIRALIGPTFADRILSANTAVSVVVFLMAYKSAGLNYYLIDIALVIAMLNFVGGIAIARYSVSRAAGKRGE